MQGPRPQATHRPDAAGGIKHHTAEVAITRDRLLADLLAVAIRATPRFSEKFVGRVFEPAQPEPQNIPRQTINNWLWSLSRLKKLAGFSPSRPPARYSTGYETRRSPCAYYPEHVPAVVLPMASLATPRFSREIRRSNFLANATRAQKHSVTTYTLLAVVSVAGPRTFQFHAEPIQPTPKPTPRGSPTAREAC